MRLLVTRPEPDALKLRAALEERGHEATVEPLLSVSFDDTDPIDLEGVQALIATSRNGLRALKLASAARRGAQAAAVRGRPGDGARGARARLRDGRDGRGHGRSSWSPTSCRWPIPPPACSCTWPATRWRATSWASSSCTGSAWCSRWSIACSAATALSDGNGRAAGHGRDRGRHLDVAANGVNLCRADAQAGARLRCPRARAFLPVGGNSAATRAAWARSAARLPRRPAWKKCLP